MHKKYVIACLCALSICVLTYKKFSFTVSKPMSPSKKILESIIQSSPDEVQTLLQNVTSLDDVRGKYGETILHRAAEQGTPNLVKEVLQKGVVGIDVQDEYGKTSVMWAIQGNNLPTVKKLLELGADVSIKDKAGMTALDIAHDYKQKSEAIGWSTNFDKIIILLQEKMK